MFFQQLVNGLTLGSVYAVIAIGYTLVFGVLNIVNMAHGGIIMRGAYIGLLLVTMAGWGLFPALGAAAGVLIALSFNALEPTMGTSMGFKGMAVLIMGGLGNVGGAMAGGFILGVAEVFSVAYGASSFRDAVAFGLIILILFIRPQGLFAKAGKGRRP